ncbi:hypothetical protein GUJ93_ZPchr0010g10938 [Zizania palustris]|uniref:Uncharacterized protein n=1 Tax=Zizania palustris TaxID=103762 RepID=A0A8J5WER7_ZIZPA|nr:hypothetical protein GUJ93_ZPchr0010g10938 [Zizania palustris]
MCEAEKEAAKENVDYMNLSDNNHRRTNRVSAEEEVACKPRRSSQRSTNLSSSMRRSDDVLIDWTVKAKKKAVAAWRSWMSSAATR